MSWQKIMHHGVEVGRFPKPGTRWKPLHPTPHGPKKAITIQRFIAQYDKKKTK